MECKKSTKNCRDFASTYSTYSAVAISGRPLCSLCGKLGFTLISPAIVLRSTAVRAERVGAFCSNQGASADPEAPDAKCHCVCLGDGSGKAQTWCPLSGNWLS